MNVHIDGLVFGFLTLLALLMAAAALALVVVGPLRKRSSGAGGLDAQEARLHLAFVIGQALLVTHLASWPMLYACLQSLVPLVPGAMCVFGVTREGGAPAVFVQMGEPVVVFAGGVWFVCYRIYREAGRVEAIPRVTALLGAVAALSVIQSVAVLAFLLLPRGQASVACCNTVFDQPGRFTARLPASLLGPEPGAWVAPVALVALAVAMLTAWLARRRVLERGVRSGPALALVGAASLSSGVVYLFEVAAPVLLGQPSHHCLFDVVPAVPAMGVALLAFALGHFALGWAAAAATLGPSLGEPAAVASTFRDCLVAAILLLSAYAIVLSIHVAIA